ncbi:MAG: DUF2326 domain-containing protein [Sphaerochaeta sp.]|nr:DUF2326 domain-containing protein [Sphaerochaeta sp.]
MFIKSLIIASPTEIIREIIFKAGINLIVDRTPPSEGKLTGNNVGKTTVLKLVDFCLGAEPSIIYTDTENKKEVYSLVKDYLIKHEIVVTLTLVEDLRIPQSKKIVIERNFLQRNKAVHTLNGVAYAKKEFDAELHALIVPNRKAEKPTLRQIISHNIRYKDENINNTLQTLDRYTSDIEYETLYLFLLGCNFDKGAKKQAFLTQQQQEVTFKARLEKQQTKTAYEIALSILEDEIAVLQAKRASFNLNEDFAEDLDKLNSVKYMLNRSSSSISKMQIRRELIEDAKKELEDSITSIDLKQLEILYSEAKMNISGIQKTFSELVAYHNTMVVEKANFIVADLPTLSAKIDEEKMAISVLLKEEKELSNKIAKGDSFGDLEKIIGDLNAKYQLKGEFESIIFQVNEVEDTINRLKEKIDNINDVLFSDEFEKDLKSQVTKFNKHFSSISKELYGETYALTYERKENKNRQKFYKFSSFNTNMSSGKKQGEILCFDVAYIFFADEENISCLHFLLNDKKELMHDNQLNKVADFLQDKNIQLIVSILKDKLPDTVLDIAHTAVELSQDSKLFKIESASGRQANKVNSINK